MHNWLGLSTGLIVPGNNDPAFKREQYAADITYGTNNEFGFDYLRDNMAPSRERQVQRGHVYAIVDEVDLVLIDEARTPLIISGRVADAAALLQVRLHRPQPEARRRLRGRRGEAHGRPHRGRHREGRVPARHRQPLRRRRAEPRPPAPGRAQGQGAVQADKDYVVAGGEVKIVDEFTGRILEGRRWSEGLHQAVEAKEGVRIKEENQTLATVTLQNYFRMYDKLAGMTGTAQSDAAELAATYELQVVPIPTNSRRRTLDQADHLQGRGRQVRRRGRRHRRTLRAGPAGPGRHHLGGSPSACPACWTSRASSTRC